MEESDLIKFYKQVLFAGIFLFFLGGLLSIVTHINNKKIHDDFIKSEYSGIIWQINYDEKGIPSVFINDKKYDLIFYYSDLRSYLQVGDSIVKKKDNGNLLVYRKNNGSFELQIFGNW